VIPQTPKVKITISLDSDLKDLIERIVNDNEDYLKLITNDGRSAGISTLINLILRAIFKPEQRFDDIMLIDKAGDNYNIGVTIRILLKSAIDLELEKLSRSHRK